MAIKKVWISDVSQCTSCHLCEDSAPDVFEVQEAVKVKADANLANESGIKDASQNCPVEIIKYE